MIRFLIGSILWFFGVSIIFKELKCLKDVLVDGFGIMLLAIGLHLMFG